MSALRIAKLFDHDGPITIQQNQAAAEVVQNLGSLSIGERLQALKELHRLAGDLVTQPVESTDAPPIINTLVALYNSIPFDAAYQAHVDASWKKFEVILSADPQFIDMLLAWPDAPAEKRAKFLYHVARMHNVTMSDETLVFKEHDILFGQELPEDIAAEYNDQEQILYRSHVRGLNFGDALEILVHENTHAQQDRIAAAGRQKALDPDSPFYKQADIFGQQLGAYYRAYCTATKEIYMAQFIEREAHKAEKIPERACKLATHYKAMRDTPWCGPRRSFDFHNSANVLAA